MLQLVIPGEEIWDDEQQYFIYSNGYVLPLEHSLVSLSKWESKWGKPFLSKNDMSHEETIDYIRCMTLIDNAPDEIYSFITQKQINEVSEYINANMTATTFSKEKGGKANREVITAELIYYWMITAQIPFECQYWHLNRLITLIRVCSVKNAPAKKMSAKEAARQRQALNAQRRAQLNTRG